MKWVMIILAALVVAAIVGVIFVRTASHDPSEWHIDVTTITEIDDRNQFLGGTRFDADLAAIRAAVSGAIDGEVLAGDINEDFVTYIVRTPVIGFPDYVTVGIIPADEGWMVDIFSRSRFGQSDLGANKARVEQVFADVKAALGDSS